MRIKELIKYGKKLLKENEMQDSSIMAKTLAEYILQMDRMQIIINEEKEIKEEEKTRYYLALIEIVQGMPLQYITNKQKFMNLEFYVDENVLIPQPDTEILVEEVINIAKDNKNELEILDLCTGSGCIGISLAKNINNANVTMTDISRKALNIAKINCEKNEIKNNIEFKESNMFKNISKKYDIIVSNPPYIKKATINTLPKNVQKEPKIALDGGEDGLDFYKILVDEAYKFLNDEGYLCLEIGYDQKEAVMKLLKDSKQYREICCKKDLSGNDRIVISKKKINK